MAVSFLKGHHLPLDVVLFSAYAYFSYKPGYRDLEERATRGVQMDHVASQRRIIKWADQKKPVHTSRRMNETPYRVTN